MIEQLLIIANSLLFLLIGYYLRRPNSTTTIKPTQLSSNLPKPKKNFLEKAGIIEYPSQDEIDYVTSGQDKVDEERERVFKEQFNVKP